MAEQGPENTLISTLARPHKAPKTTPENPKSPKTQITSPQQPIFDTHQVGSAWLPGSGRKVENQIFDARTAHLDGRRHSNAKANFQGTVRTDPEAPEKINMIFNMSRIVPF